MKTLFPFLTLLIVIPCSVNAEEVFKCKSPQGEMIYQPSPCVPNEAPVGVLKLKEMTPQEVEAANAKLKAEETEEAAYDAERAKEAKQQQMQLEQQQKLDLQRRSVEAQERQAIAAQQQQRRTYGGIRAPAYGEINP